MFSSRVKLLELYEFDGKTFASLPDVKKYVENEIGQILDSTPNRLSAADRLALLEAITSQRERLGFLLSATYAAEAGSLQAKVRSIFTL